MQVVVQRLIISQSTGIKLLLGLTLCLSLETVGTISRATKTGNQRQPENPIKELRASSIKSRKNKDSSFNILKKEITSSSIKIIGPIDGSGVIVKRSKSTYHVLTAWHVLKHVAESEKVLLMTSDHQDHTGSIKSIERIGASDLAVITFKSKKNYTTAELLETSFPREMKIIVAGYPNGSDTIYFDDGRITFSSVQAIEDGFPNLFMDQGYQLVYTSKTQFGISGGGIYTTKGQLIGIHGRGELDKQVTERERKKVKSGVNYGLPLNLYLDPENKANIHRIQKVIATGDDYELEGVNSLPIHRGNERMVITLMDELISREDHFPAYLYKARALDQIGDLTGSIQALSKGLSLPNLTIREKSLGLIHRASANSVLANFEETINDNRELISLASHPSQAKYNELTFGDQIVSSNLAIIKSLKYLNRNQEALEIYAELRRYREENKLKPFAEYQIENALAHEKFHNGEHAEALNLIESSLSHLESIHRKTVRDLLTGDDKRNLEGKEYLRKSLDYSFVDDQIKSNRLFIAQFIYPKLGRLDDALSIINEYISQDQFDLDTLDARVGYYRSIRDYNNAEIDALKILDIEPRNSDALHNLSLIYRFRDNNIQKSCLYLAKSFQERGGDSFYSDTIHTKDCRKLGLLE